MFTTTSWGQNCPCDITLSNLKNSSNNVIISNTIDYKAGDVICIPGGRYAGLEFVGFEGKNNNPLTITNCDGQVIIEEHNKSGITFRNSKYIHLTGTGDSVWFYGFNIENAQGPGAVGVNIADYSSDIEIDHIEIQNTSFAGILAKTDPKCNDMASWRRNGYVLGNLNIHHNYIHHTGGEGIYLGHTGGYKVSSNLNCNGEFVFGHWLENIKVHHNNLENIGWDAIQANLVRQFGFIYENTISTYGLEDRQFQNFAMSIGGGDYDIFNNTIINTENGFGQGIQLISAQSGSKLFNNVIINPRFHGIFIHNRHEFDDDNEGYYILNNTIINPELSGVFYNTIITESDNTSLISTTQEKVPTLMVNNLIGNPGNHFEEGNTWKGSKENYFDFNKRITKVAMQGNIYSNLTTRQLDTLCLAGLENYDFRPASEASPLIDAGSDMTIYGGAFDHDNNTRFKGRGMDIGAYEYQDEILAFDCIGYGDDILKGGFISNGTTVAYPIPTTKSITFNNMKYETAYLQFFAQDGALVHSCVYEIGSSHDVSDFAKGLYFVGLQFDEHEEIHKIIIE